MTHMPKEKRLLSMLNEAKKLNSSLICDVGEAKIHNLSPYFNNYSDDLKLIGPIEIVETASSILPILDKLSVIDKNKIIFIHDTTPEKALLGDIIMLDAKMKGLLGIICTGYIRDTDEQKDIDLAIWAKGVTPFANKLGRGNSSVNSIFFNDIHIENDDWVFGDKDGIVLLKKQDARLIIKSASIKNKKELAYKKRILEGESVTDMMNIRNHIDYNEEIKVEF